MLNEMHGSIRLQVAAGFDTLDDIVVNTVEALSDDYDPVVLVSYAQQIATQVLKDHLDEQALWNAVTDCDRLDRSFAALDQVGIVCQQNFSCCGSCGSTEIWSVVNDVRNTGIDVRGYAFYHMQDTESAVDGSGVYLSYGAVEQGEASALLIGREIVAVLNQHGLKTQWDESWSTRIFVELIWQRRWRN